VRERDARGIFMPLAAHNAAALMSAAGAHRQAVRAAGRGASDAQKRDATLLFYIFRLSLMNHMRTAPDAQFRVAISSRSRASDAAFSIILPARQRYA